MKVNYGITKLPYLALTLIIMISGLVSCKEDEPTPQEKTTDLLTSGTWKMKTVTVDGTDQTSVYTGLTITFTATGYTSTQGGGIWPASGTWSYKEQSATVIVRNDGLEITIQEVTETSLRLAFSWTKTTLGSGKTQSVSGQHVLSFTK